MIRTEVEYQESVRKLREQKQQLADHKARLQSTGLSRKEIQRAMDPLLSFYLQLEEEIESYERIKRGDPGELSNLHGMGQTLVALRIALNLTQRQLAERLGVHESQVSRDERNEYHGVTVERVSRILDALGVTLKSTFESPLVSSATNSPGTSS